MVKKLTFSVEKLPKRLVSELGNENERQTKSMVSSKTRTIKSTQWTTYGRSERGSRKMKFKRTVEQKKSRLARKGWKRENR